MSDKDALQEARGVAGLASMLVPDIKGDPAGAALACAQLATAQAMIALVERLDQMTADKGTDQPAIRVLAYDPSSW